LTDDNFKETVVASKDLFLVAFIAPWWCVRACVRVRALVLVFVFFGGGRVAGWLSVLTSAFSSSIHGLGGVAFAFGGWIGFFLPFPFLISTYLPR